MPMCYMQILVLSVPKVYFKPTFFPIYSLQVPDIYLNYEDFTWRESEFEELTGGYSQEMSMLRIGVPKSQFYCRLILMIMKCKYIHL